MESNWEKFWRYYGIAMVLLCFAGGLVSIWYLLCYLQISVGG